MHKSVFCYNKPISEALNKICPTSATDHTTGIIWMRTIFTNDTKVQKDLRLNGKHVAHSNLLHISSFDTFRAPFDKISHCYPFFKPSAPHWGISINHNSPSFHINWIKIKIERNTYKGGYSERSRPAFILSNPPILQRLFSHHHHRRRRLRLGFRSHSQTHSLPSAVRVWSVFLPYGFFIHYVNFTHRPSPGGSWSQFVACRLAFK